MVKELWRDFAEDSDSEEGIEEVGQGEFTFLREYCCEMSSCGGGGQSCGTCGGQEQRETEEEREERGERDEKRSQSERLGFVPPLCIKCNESRAQFVAHQREPLCRQCMETSVLHKVKSAVLRPGTKINTFGEGDRLAIACSGGFNSMALIHAMKWMGDAEAQRVKPRFEIKSMIKVIHVVTTHVGDTEHSIRRVRENVLAVDPTADFVTVPLHYVLEEEEELRRVLRDQASLDLDAIKMKSIDSVIESCSSTSTARKDMEKLLTKLLSLRVANILGCTKLALGCNATYFAMHTLTSILKGSGFALPADIQYVDSRFSYLGLPDIIHPLLDCVSKELLLICYLHSIDFIWAAGDIYMKKNCAKSLCKDFVFISQDRLPSTVKTVVKIACKLDYNGIKEEAIKVLDSQGRIKEDKMCYLCSSPMCASPKLFALSQQQQQRRNNSDTGLEGKFCYSCCTMFQNFDANARLWSLGSNSIQTFFRSRLGSDDIEELRLVPIEVESLAQRGPTAASPRASRHGLTCAYCKENRAMLKRPKTKENICKECFYYAFEEEIHGTIMHEKLFNRGDRVAIGASGGKDSTVLIHVLKTLNERYDYGIELFLLSVDEGIKGYRDDSLETVARNEQQYEIPLKVLSYKDLYGYSMDDIVAQIGLKNNCTFCGVFRRQALDRGAVLLNANKIVTGHNADDIAETVFLNVLRGDFPRLTRCTNSITGEESTLPRCKPFKYTYEKEIVMYAFHKKLDYFATECTYSPQAYRGFAREFIKDVEIIEPVCILNTIISGDEMKWGTNSDKPLQVQGECIRCGYMTSQKVCKACVLLEGLRTGNARYGISKSACKPLHQKS